MPDALLQGVAWFPQQYADEFYTLKGLLALVATLLLLLHMHRTWHAVRTRGQRLRYLSLLAFAVLVTGSSVEQVHDGALVSYRNLGAVVVTVVLIVAVAVSLAEDKDRA